jgi:GntR family transcriptional repressor for pyruvate dehydrogenase complex
MTIDFVTKKSLSSLVVAKIRQLIIDNDLKVGDRLPTEQEMALRFGVSRISIREATKALSFLGIINSAPRRGLTIGSVNLDRLADIFSFHFMLEDYPKAMLLNTRYVVECGCLPYAMQAINNDKSLCDKLLELCGILETTKDPQQYVDADIEFHKTLVMVSGIEPLVAFNDILQTFFRKFEIKKDIALTKNILPEGAKAHRQIIEALQQLDQAKAEAVLRQHLSFHQPKTD